MPSSRSKSSSSSSTKAKKSPFATAKIAEKQPRLEHAAKTIPMLPLLTQLATALATRLSYASWKVSHGCTQNNIHEVENFYHSRFRAQAEQREGLHQKGKSRQFPAYPAQHPAPASSYYVTGHGEMVIDEAALQAGQTFTSAGGPFADAAAAENGPTYPFGELSHEHITETEPQYQIPVVQRQPTPPLPPPSPSMYNYLVSPLVGSKPTFSPVANGPVGRYVERPPSSLQHSYSTGNGYGDFWQGAAGAERPQYEKYQENIQAAMMMGDGHSRESTFVAPVSQPSISTSGQSLLPPAGISTQTSQPINLNPGHDRRFSLTGSGDLTSSYSGGGVQDGFYSSGDYGQGLSFGSPLRRHQHHKSNSQSLRGEFSSSNVTMEDLDTHFGFESR